MSETVILNWRPGGYRDEKLITATWSGGVMWGRPSWDSDAEREIKSRILKVVPGAKFRWAGAKVDAETRADLAVDARKMNPRRVSVNVSGAMKNPAGRLHIGDRVMGLMGVDGGYVGVVESISADRRGKIVVSFRGDDGVLRDTYLSNVTKNVPPPGEFPRKNPFLSGVLMSKGNRLALADDSDEESRLRDDGWNEAGVATTRKLARLRQLDKNGWAELTDRPFTESDLEDALSRQNPKRTSSSRKPYDRLPV